MLIADCGITIVWSNTASRFIASGRSLNSSSNVAIKQAKLVSDSKEHFRIAKKMYNMRFPDDLISQGITNLEKLRGLEGQRMKNVYKDNSSRTGVRWKRRISEIEKIEENDLINQALTYTNQILYGCIQSVVVQLGYLPQLGFVHVGRNESFIYDIADLYKSEITIPLSFDLVKSYDCTKGFDKHCRIGMRNEVRTTNFLSKIVKDLNYLFEEDKIRDADYIELVDGLWNGEGEIVSSSKNYSYTASSPSSSLSQKDIEFIDLVSDSL